MSENSVFPDWRMTYLPLAAEQSSKLRSAQGRFAYYTTSAVACKILETRQIWLRDARAMNDYSELKHGHYCLSEALRSDAAKLLQRSVENCFPGLWGKVISRANEEFFDRYLSDTYISCFSEHLPKDSKMGRLSMWRAYGARSGVAIIFNRDVGQKISGNVLGVFASPVLYGGVDEITRGFILASENISRSSDELRLVGEKEMVNGLHHILRTAIIATKHPGFLEEQEWRIYASPKMHPSNFLETNIEVVRGVPEKLIKLTLRDSLEFNIQGLDLNDCIDELIIGPCDYPEQTRLAILELMERAGISDPERRISPCGIPLRHF